jgi:hypothetical protein
MMAANDEYAHVAKAVMTLFSKRNRTPSKFMSPNKMNENFLPPAML